MTDVRIQGTPTTARVKTLAPAVAPLAETILSTKKDGFDTYGVKTDAGDQLILTQSKKPLKTSDFVTVGGKQAAVTFVENEANSFGERFKAGFFSKGSKIAMGAGSVIAMGIATPFGVALGVHPIGWVIGLALWAAVGAGVMAAGSAGVNAVRAGLGDNKTDETVTNGLSAK